MKIDKHFIRMNSQDVHYVTAGEGFPLLLLHGGSNDWHEWKDNIDALSEHYRVIAPDIIGFGLSDKSKEIYSIKDFIIFTNDFISALQLERVHIIGHSLGARVALEFASYYPERIDKVVSIAPWGLGRLSNLGYVIGALAHWLRKLTFKPQPYPVLSLDGPDSNPETFNERLKSIKAQTLIIWGQRDRYLSVKQAHKAHELIEKSSVEIFKNCGHAPQREDKDHFNELIPEFLLS